MGETILSRAIAHILTNDKDSVETTSSSLHKFVHHVKAIKSKNVVFAAKRKNGVQQVFGPYANSCHGVRYQLIPTPNEGRGVGTRGEGWEARKTELHAAVES